MNPRRGTSPLLLAALALTLAACGGEDTGTDTTPTTAPAAQATPGAPVTPSPAATGPTGPPAEPAEDTSEQDDLDRRVEEADDRLEQAAKRGDRAAVAAAERDLGRLARQDRNQRPLPPTAAGPYERELARVRFKQPPLFIQQITSTPSSHDLFISVHAAQLCLKTAHARTAAIDAVYAPMDRRLRRAGINDFRIYVTPVTHTAPTRPQALAIAGHGTVRLTSRGRRCAP